MSRDGQFEIDDNVVEFFFKQRTQKKGCAGKTTKELTARLLGFLMGDFHVFLWFLEYFTGKGAG